MKTNDIQVSVTEKKLVLPGVNLYVERYRITQSCPCHEFQTLSSVVYTSEGMGLCRITLEGRQIAGSGDSIAKIFGDFQHTGATFTFTFEGVRITRALLEQFSVEGDCETEARRYQVTFAGEYQEVTA